jgi:hypothetical protein
MERRIRRDLARLLAMKRQLDRLKEETPDILGL